MGGVLVFGYGSLINQKELKLIIPEVKEVRPAYVNGFKRVFNFWDGDGLNNKDLTMKGKPYCALNLNNGGGIINGVAFEVDENSFKKIIKWEDGYETMEIGVYDYNDKKLIGNGFLFFSKEKNGKYNFNSEEQEQYLKICLSGAKDFGKEFYSEFLETTFIGGVKLSKIDELKHLL